MNRSLTFMTRIASLIVLVLVGIFGAAHLKAAVIMQPLTDTVIHGDFVVGPGKLELALKPGETRTFEVDIANRLGLTQTFALSKEDITGSNDASKSVVLLGDDRGPYSLKDMLTLASATVSVPRASEARIPVTVRVPANATPGGLYGSVVVETIPAKDSTATVAGVSGTSPVVTRVAVLIFVRVLGPATESGSLKKFTLGSGQSVLWDSKPLTFDLLFQNDGTVNLDPSGLITVTSMFGTTVDAVAVEPWFALPGSLRSREVTWNPGLLLGRYVAHVSVNRGYGAAADQMDVVFWVIPWKALVAGLIILAGVAGIVLWLMRSIRGRSVATVVILAACVTTALSASADTMSSSRYTIQSDSMNFAGTRSSSATYSMEDTLGEIATGEASSTNYAMHAGYQQMQTVALAVVPASNVALTPTINGLNGGTANGSTTFRVTTDDPAGYSVTLAEESAPALKSGANNFADYTPAGAVPDFTFSNGVAASSFAFSPEGNDIATRYQDSGAVCGVSGSDTADACWDGLSLTPVTIVSRTSANQPAGTLTTVKFRAASGSGHVQPDGTYIATTTLTITAM